MTSAVLAAAIVLLACYWLSRPRPGTPEADLAQADQMAFNNNWMGAEPRFHDAELEFREKGDTAQALYAEVSRIPAHMESRPLPDLIAEVSRMLSRPEAHDPRTRLRILTVRGMLELEYDAASAKSTWAEVQVLAGSLGEWRLASRANGEQGILAFLLGHVDEARDRVISAYKRAIVLMDRPAQVRYAELMGRGLVEFGRYQESFKYLDKAIGTAEAHPEIARPMIAYEAKANALVGLKRYAEALELTRHFLDMSRVRNLRENMAEGLGVEASIFAAEGDWNKTVAAYGEALKYAESVKHWRSVNDLNAGMAKAYEQMGRYDEAMRAINAAIAANQQTPEEIYYVPRNLALKAEITAKAGQRRQAEELYRQGEDELEVLLRHAPTPNIERSLLSELAELYSGDFSLLADDGRLQDAFEVIERAHGRIEAQSLWYDHLRPPQRASAQEREVNALELELLDATDLNKRAAILNRIYDAEQRLPTYTPGPFRNPIPLSRFRSQLSDNEVLLEYVLGEPTSSVLVVSSHAVSRSVLPSRAVIERDIKTYVGKLHQKKADSTLAEGLFRTLIPQSAELGRAATLIVVPDGVLNTLPFGALADSSGKYLITARSVVNAPSATVLNLLRTRQHEKQAIPYLGVAAWTQAANSHSWFVQRFAGPQRSELVPLPESKREIETAAHLLPQPETLLLGSDATRAKFLSLPLEKYDVLHLSLHGYPDMEFPDRSALVFAPAPEVKDSGFLQAREIRQLRLSARLVTLSACKTSVGPTYESGTASIVNAFVEAGAQSVVSTLWDVDDRAGRKLMESFYRYLAAGQGRAEALQHAEAEFANAGEPPYYWANFQIVGDAIEPLYSERTLVGVADQLGKRKLQ